MIARTARLAVLGVMAACASARPVSRTEATPNARVSDGLVAVVTTADAKGCKDPRACAQQDAVRALLFVGVPGSTSPKPLVANEAEAVRGHKEFFADLLEKQGYAKYVVQIADASAPSASEKSWTIVINSDALRRALEGAGIIRRFGY